MSLLVAVIDKVLPHPWQRVALACAFGALVGGLGQAYVIAPRERERLARCEAELKPRHEVQIVFRDFDLDQQLYGGDAELLIGKVNFAIIVDGEMRGDYSARVRLVTGARYDTSEPFVEPPLRYTGPFNQQAFAEDAVRYIRRAMSTCETPADRVKQGRLLVSNARFANEWSTRFRADPQPEL